jgi:rare lipoprotein A
MILIRSFLPLHIRTIPNPVSSENSWRGRRIDSVPIGWIGLTIVFFMMAGCAGGYHRTGPVTSEHPQRGVASWYGPSFHGNPTASGERYDMWALTAAHRTLPFGTRVLVQCVDTGKTVTVKINDRGPFIRGRVIDLSYGAARELTMIGKGTTDVILTILDSPSSGHSGNLSNGRNQKYWVQAGSFSSMTPAVSLREKLVSQYPQVRLKTVDLPSGRWHRVQVGTFHSQEKAQTVKTELENRFNLDPLLIKDN